MEGGEEFVSVTKDEVQYFDTLEPSRKLLGENATFITNINIINLSFKESNKGYINDGQFSYYATVEDKRFLEEIQKNKPFSKGDVLKVRVRREQYSIRDECKLKTDNFIEHVLEHNSPAQLELDIF